MNAEEVIHLINSLWDVFVQQNILTFILYKLLWLFIMSNHTILNSLEGTLDQVLTFSGFLNSEALNDFIGDKMVYAYAILGLVILYIGIRYMMGKSIQLTDVWTHLLLAMFAIMAISQITTWMTDLTTDAVNVSKLDSKNEKTSLSTQIISRNTTDLLYLSRKGKWKQDDKNFVNNEITDKNIKYTDFTGVINPLGKSDVEKAGDVYYDLSDDEKKIFGNKVVTGADGKQSLAELDQFKIPMMDPISWLSPFYYRYHANIFGITVQQIVLMAVLIFASFKVLTLLLEIAFKKFLLPFVAVSDLRTGQKLKNLLKEILLNFVAIDLVFFSMRMYMLAMTYLGTLHWSPILNVIAALAMGIFVINGPDTVKSLLGIDIGVKDGYHQLMGAVGLAGAGIAGGKAFSDLTKKATESTENSVENARNVLGGFKGKSIHGVEQLAHTAGVVSEAGLGGFVGKKASDLKNGVSEKASQFSENVQEGLANNRFKQAYASGQAEGNDINQQGIHENNLGPIGGSVSQSVTSVLDNNEGIVSPTERTVIEKVMKDPSSQTTEERQVIENLMNSGKLNPQDSQAIGQLLSQGGQPEVSDAQRHLMERLTQDDQPISAHARQSIENVLRNSPNTSENDRTVFENVMRQNQGHLSSEEMSQLTSTPLVPKGINQTSSIDQTVNQKQGAQLSNQASSIDQTVNQKQGAQLSNQASSIDQTVNQKQGVSAPAPVTSGTSTTKQVTAPISGTHFSNPVSSPISGTGTSKPVSAPVMQGINIPTREKIPAPVFTKNIERHTKRHKLGEKF